MAWNVASVNIGWFGCVLPAAAGMPWVGLPIVGVLVAIHIGLTDARRRELLTLLAAGVTGYVLDSAGVLAGAFAFPPAAQLGGPTTLWMVAMWLNFAVCLNVALHWLSGRPLLAITLGALGGPVAYLGGLQLGGMLAPNGMAPLIGFVALQWAVAMPVLLALTARIGDALGQPVPARAARTTNRFFSGPPRPDPEESHS